MKKDTQRERRVRYIKLQDDGRIRIGIIGTGANVSVADWHTRGIIHDRRARISAVYNRRESTTQRWKDRFSLDAVSCTTPEMPLEACDAVVICTPNSTHYQYAMAALAAGKHVLLEKPMTLSLEQAEQLEAVAGQMGVHCCVGYTYRFTQAADQLRSLVRNHIGNVYTVQASLGGTRLADAGIGMDWRMYQALSGAGALEAGLIPRCFARATFLLKTVKVRMARSRWRRMTARRSPAVVEAGLAAFLSAAWDWMRCGCTWREKEGWRE